jgi:hypothetical protein
MSTTNDFPEVDNKQERIKELAMTLDGISYQVAELLRIKESLEAKLCAMLDHGDDGSKTYTVDRYKVTVKTGWIYTLNKEEFAVIGERLPKCFNPVKQRVSFDLDKSIIRECEKYGSVDDLNLLSQLISKKPSKLNIKVSAAS